MRTEWRRLEFWMGMSKERVQVVASQSDTPIDRAWDTWLATARWTRPFYTPKQNSQVVPKNGWKGKEEATTSTRPTQLLGSFTSSQRGEKRELMKDKEASCGRIQTLWNFSGLLRLNEHDFRKSERSTGAITIAHQKDWPIDGEYFYWSSTKSVYREFKRIIGKF